MGSRRCKNGLSKTLAVLLLAPTLGACASMRHFEWAEDVRLSDGKTIVVQRTVEYQAFADLRGGRSTSWVLTNSSVKANLPPPVERKVSFDGSLLPLALEVLSNSSVYLVGVAATGAALTEWNLPPNEFHVAFKLEEEGWRRIPLKDLPVSVRLNLLGSVRTLFMEREARSGMHLSLEFKRELDSNPLIDKRLTTIVRP